MSEAVLATKLAQSERMCPTDTHQHTQHPEHRAHRPEAHRSKEEHTNMTRSQTVNWCVFTYDRMDRSTRDRKEEGERGQRMGEGEVSHVEGYRGDVRKEEAVSDRGGEADQPSPGQKQRERKKKECFTRTGIYFQKHT